MNEPIKILGTDYPQCVHTEGDVRCCRRAMDGYCQARCCVGSFSAYCSEHSHRPTRLLEILGHAHDKPVFLRAEVEDILKAVWVGAGMVFESAGYLEMLRDLAAKRASAVR